MKKIFALILIISLLLSSSALGANLYMRFSTFGSTENIGSVFNGDSFSLDLYMTYDDLTAFIQQTVWNGNDTTTSIKLAKIKSKVGDSKTLYFVFADDTYYTGHYDEEYSFQFWLDLPGGSIKLTMADEFFSNTDFKEATK